MTRRQSPGRRRTPQQRKRAATARRVAELEQSGAVEEEATTSPATEEAAPVRRTLLGGLITRQSRPATRADIAETFWSLRGRLTLVLLMAVLFIPLGVAAYFANDQGNVSVTDSAGNKLAYHYSFAYFVFSTPSPASLIPIPLLIATFVAMPLARSLAGEKRSFRVLETLGFAAVVDIVLIVLYSAPLPRHPASYTDGKAVAALGLVDAVALVVGAVIYNPIRRWLSPARRMRPPVKPPPR